MAGTKRRAGGCQLSIGRQGSGVHAALCCRPGAADPVELFKGFHGGGLAYGVLPRRVATVARWRCGCTPILHKVRLFEFARRDRSARPGANARCRSRAGSRAASVRVCVAGGPGVRVGALRPDPNIEGSPAQRVVPVGSGSRTGRGRGCGTRDRVGQRGGCTVRHLPGSRIPNPSSSLRPCSEFRIRGLLTYPRFQIRSMGPAHSGLSARGSG